MEDFLRSSSIMWSFIHVMVLFLMLYDLRFDRRKNILISVAAMMPFILLTSVLVWILGPETASQLVFVTLSIPSLIFFMLMSKKVDGRFFFTFCMADTLSTEFLTLSMMLDHWLGGDKAIVLFLFRMAAFPILELIVWKYFRRPYLQMQASLKKGWGVFAVISLLYYVLLGVMISFPTMITDRPEDVPALMMVFLIMPLTYAAIFMVLISQKQLYDTREQKRHVDRQAALLEDELAMERDYVEKARRSRHDLRHNIRLLCFYLDNGDYERAREYLADYDSSIDDGALTAYCENEIANALLRMSARKCEKEGICFTANTVIPAQLPYSRIDTATLFANLLENAWEAAAKCDNPFIDISAQCRDGTIYVQIRNSCPEGTEMNDETPASTKPGGGIGLHSVREVLERHGGMIHMKCTDSEFVTRIIQKL